MQEITTCSEIWPKFYRLKFIKDLLRLQKMLIENDNRQTDRKKGGVKNEIEIERRDKKEREGQR